jgi:hypothetical protein
MASCGVDLEDSQKLPLDLAEVAEVAEPVKSEANSG